MATNQLWQQSEIVRTKAFPEWMEKKFNVFLDLVAKGEEQQVGERNYRVPAQLTPGGRAGTYDPQMGDMGRGTSPTGLTMIQSYFNARLNYEFDQLQIKATQSKKTAIQNPFLKAVADGYREFMLYWDKWIHGNGTAALATATAHSSSSGVSVYTLASNFGAQLLRRGQFVTIYDSTLTTIRSAGTLFINGLNSQGRTITLSGVVPGATATDVICFEGVSGASPAGPRGLGYWISNATSGTTAGIDRSKESQIISKSVNANNAPWTAEMTMAIYHRILNDRGEVADSIVGLAAPAQQAAVYSNVMSIQLYDLAKSAAEATDRLPKLKGRKNFLWGNVPHTVDIHADTSQVYYVAPDTFGWARLAPVGFFETPGKSGADARFFNLFGASGAPAAGVWFGLTRDEDLYTVDPGAQATLYNLPLGALYQ
jgi:hypothetical protein